MQNKNKNKKKRTQEDGSISVGGMMKDV